MLHVVLCIFKPEALSRSNTPMSPATNLSFATVNITKEVSSKYVNGSLPFHEIESCTASKQEHVISVVSNGEASSMLHLKSLRFC